MMNQGLDSFAKSTGSDLPNVALSLPDLLDCDDVSFFLSSLLQELY